jgi:splicing factor 3B subunit 1
MCILGVSLSVWCVCVLQVGDDANVMLNGFGTVVNALGRRAKPYLPQICGTIKWRLNNKAAKIRQQAADLIARIAPVLKACEEEQLLGHLGVVLYEYLGEEVRGALGSHGCENDSVIMALD